MSDLARLKRQMGRNSIRSIARRLDLYLRLIGIGMPADRAGAISGWRETQ